MYPLKRHYQSSAAPAQDWHSVEKCSEGRGHAGLAGRGCAHAHSPCPGLGLIRQDTYGIFMCVLRNKEDVFISYHKYVSNIFVKYILI